MPISSPSSLKKMYSTVTGIRTSLLRTTARSSPVPAGNEHAVGGRPCRIIQESTPRANPVERRNQEIKKGLRVRLLGQPHTRWAQCVPAILRDLRTRRNAATGYSPSRALLSYGRYLATGLWRGPVTPPKRGSTSIGKDVWTTSANIFYVISGGTPAKNHQKFSKSAMRSC